MTWLVLIFFAVLLFVQNLSSLAHPQWSSINFWLSAALGICALLLLIGKIISKVSLTVVSALIIAIILVVQLFTAGTFTLLSEAFLNRLLMISLALFFMSRG